eukprot:scaffold113397_cov33-Phaeocystis_antarctica.AAC.1
MRSRVLNVSKASWPRLLPVMHHTVRGTYGTAEAGTRTAHVQCVGPRGKLPCASGACSTQEAGTCSQYSYSYYPSYYLSYSYSYSYYYSTTTARRPHHGRTCKLRRLLSWPSVFRSRHLRSRRMSPEAA